ncbi:hypothetical protein THAOC_36819, partial [Thalassiosira oceanica]
EPRRAQNVGGSASLRRLTPPPLPLRPQHFARETLLLDKPCEKRQSQASELCPVRWPAAKASRPRRAQILQALRLRFPSPWRAPPNSASVPAEFAGRHVRPPPQRRPFVRLRVGPAGQKLGSLRLRPRRLSAPPAPAPTAQFLHRSKSKIDRLRFMVFFYSGFWLSGAGRLGGLVGSPPLPTLRYTCFFPCEEGETLERQAPDRLGKWLYREPSARGSRNGPPKGQGRPTKRVFIEILLWPPSESALYRPNATRGRTSRSMVSCGRRSTRSSDSDESSFPESSRRALQVTLSRRIQIDGARAARAREESAAQRDDSSTKGRAMIPKRPAAASRKTPGALQRSPKTDGARPGARGRGKTRGVLRGQERADDGRGSHLEPSERNFTLGHLLVNYL